MAPKKAIQIPSSSSSQEHSSKKDKPRKNHSPHSYSREELKKEFLNFKREALFLQDSWMNPLSPNLDALMKSKIFSLMLVC